MKKLIATLLMLFLSANTVADTYQFPIRIAHWVSDPYDTVIYKFYSDTILRDSLIFTAFPGDVDTFVTLTTDSNYFVAAYYSYAGEDGLATGGVLELPGSTADIGAGDNLVTVCAFDTSGGMTGIPGLKLTVRYLSGLQAAGPQFTAGSGCFSSFSLAADTYVVYGSALHYFVYPDTFVVAAAMAETLWGYNTALPPDTAAGVSYVTAYIDIGAGYVDSATGLMYPRSTIELFLDLIGAVRMLDNTWAIMPARQTKRPDSNGRCTFLTIANQKLYPATSYYRLTCRARDGTSILSGEIRQFVIDTLPDPVNILNTEEVY